jgi:hypothetical protein
VDFPHHLLAAGRWRELDVPLAKYVVVPSREEAGHPIGVPLNIVGDEIKAGRIQLAPDNCYRCGIYRKLAMR